MKNLRINALVNRVNAGQVISEGEFSKLVDARRYLRNYFDEDARQIRGVIDEVIEAVTEPCPGDAHKHDYADNCNRCAPLWGRIPSKRVQS